ncbi:MAG: enolase C-terminal domain-like protein [Acidobacteriota bacterium]
MIHLEAGGLSAYQFSYLQPVTTSRTKHAQRSGLFVWLRDSRGRRGWGEAAPLVGHSLEHEADARAALQRVLRVPLLDIDPLDALDSITNWLSALEPLPPSARFALETALLDLVAQTRAIPIHRVLRADRPAPVPLAGLLAGDNEDALESQAQALHDSGILTWKIKLGSEGLDLAQRTVLTRWRRHLADRLVLRADANGSLLPHLVPPVCEQLAEWRCEYLEQPLPVGMLERIPSPLPLPIAADEELRDADGIEQALRHPSIRVLVIKPAMLGGLIPALALASRAREVGKQVVITHMLEAEVAFAAACELALALDPAPLACGLVPLPIDDCSIACGSLPQRRGNQLVGDGYVGLGTAPE